MCCTCMESILVLYYNETRAYPDKSIEKARLIIYTMLHCTTQNDTINEKAHNSMHKMRRMGYMYMYRV